MDQERNEMSKAKIRFVVTAGVFAAWMGYLCYLALIRPTPTVLSRAQFTGVSVIVVADVRFEDGKPIKKIQIRETLKGEKLPAEAEISNWDRAILSNNKPFTESGPYLLALEPSGDGFRLAYGAPSPGYERPPMVSVVYPWRDETEKQIRALLK
jgi:hypothetical protein